MGDRIAVMNDGVLEQVGTPGRVYERPGEPLRRRLHRQPGDGLTRAGVERNGGASRLVLGELRLDRERCATCRPRSSSACGRSTRARGTETPGCSGRSRARVEYAEALGRETLVGVAGAGARGSWSCRRARRAPSRAQTLRFGLRRGWLYLFDAVDERALGRV